MIEWMDGSARWISSEPPPEWGIVLGSGLGRLVACVEEEARFDYADIEGIPMSGVPGHAGQFVVGTLEGRRVIVAQGRAHLYEGWSGAEVTAGVRFMASLGVRRLVLTNAAGTLNAGQPPGNWMVISDQLNLTGTSPLLGGANFKDMTAIYGVALRDRFKAAAMALGMPLFEGVYAGVLGPQYETPAEIRMLRILGADAVGMSTVLESIQAHALGLEVAGFSCLTNWAAGLSPGPLSHAEVIEVGGQSAQAFISLLAAVLGAR